MQYKVELAKRLYALRRSVRARGFDSTGTITSGKSPPSPVAASSSSALTPAPAASSGVLSRLTTAAAADPSSGAGVSSAPVTPFCASAIELSASVPEPAAPPIGEPAREAGVEPALAPIPVVAAGPAAVRFRPRTGPAGAPSWATVFRSAFLRRSPPFLPLRGPASGAPELLTLAVAFKAASSASSNAGVPACVPASEEAATPSATEPVPSSSSETKTLTSRTSSSAGMANTRARNSCRNASTLGLSANETM